MKSSVSWQAPAWFRNGRRAGTVFLFALAAAAQQPRFPQLKLEETSGTLRVLAERMLKETRAGLGRAMERPAAQPRHGGGDDQPL